jgi:CRP-like cAMP-binding protein
MISFPMMSPLFLNALETTPFLTGLNKQALALLAQEGTVRNFDPAEIIVREGSEGHAFFILVEGDVEVIKYLDSPHAVTLARLHAGTFFGEMGVVDPVPRAATVRAISKVTAIEITAATLHHLFRKMPEQYAIMILNLARDLARRLRSLDEAFAAKAS